MNKWTGMYCMGVDRPEAFCDTLAASHAVTSLTVYAVDGGAIKSGMVSGFGL